MDIFVRFGACVLGYCIVTKSLSFEITSLLFKISITSNLTVLRIAWKGVVAFVG